MRRPEVKEIITDEIKLQNWAEEISTKTENPLLREIVSDLKATMKANNLKSLSAPAIGYNYRIFCVDAGIEIKTYINPVAYNDPASKPTAQAAIETCSSIPGKRYLRFRTDKISMMYQRPNGLPESKEFSGWLAVVIQHEMDHLNGIILSDYGLELDDNWEKMTQKDRAEILKEYKDSLDALSDRMNEEILADPDAKALSDGIDYLAKVATGEVQIEGIKE